MEGAADNNSNSKRMDGEAASVEEEAAAAATVSAERADGGMEGGSGKETDGGGKRDGHVLVLVAREASCGPFRLSLGRSVNAFHSVLPAIRASLDRLQRTIADPRGLCAGMHPTDSVGHPGHQF